MLRKGAYRKAAVAACNVCYPTFLNELERDPKLAADVAAAEDHCRGVLEQTVFTAAAGSKKEKPDWKAAIAYLERKFDDWARKRSDAIGLRKFMRHLSDLITGVLAFLPAEQHDAFKVWFQGWLDGVLADDRND
jgi:hypothetical protein